MRGHLPNMQQGFARNPGEALHPHLWDKNILALAPCLGGGSTIVKDFSPYHWDATASTGLTKPSVTGSPIGPAILFPSSFIAQYLEWVYGDPLKICNGWNTQVAIHAYFKYTAKGSTQYMHLLRSDNAAPADSTFYGYGLAVNAYTHDLIFYTNNDLSSLVGDMYYRYTSGTGTPYGIVCTPGAWNNVVAMFASAETAGLWSQACMMCINGRWVVPACAYPVFDGYGSANHASRRGRVGGVQGFATVDMSVALVEAWNRQMSWPEADLLMADPLAMYRQAPRLAESQSIAAAYRTVSIGGAVSRRAAGIAVSG